MKTKTVYLMSAALVSILFFYLFQTLKSYMSISQVEIALTTAGVVVSFVVCVKIINK